MVMTGCSSFIFDGRGNRGASMVAPKGSRSGLAQGEALLLRFRRLGFAAPPGG